MHNNYIIGLGGTGGDSVAAFRRATKMRAEEFKALKDAGIHFEYLYIDSNTQDINNAMQNLDGEKWGVPGGNVCLDNSECLSIDGTGMNVQAAMNLPNIRPWLGNTTGVTQPGATQIVGAGQRRRYGRMLLARRVNELNQRVAAGADALREGSPVPNEITFHIFATLGGGTGSGSVVDMVTYLRKNFAENALRSVTIYLYLYVGGDNPSVQTADVGLFYENEYASLRDLNALMCNRWKPEMAAAANGELHSTQDPIDAIFLSSEMSDVALPLSQQVDCMANACLDLISLFQNGDGNKVKAFTGEDIVPANPGEITDHSQWGVETQVVPMPGTMPERSYRFATLGVSRMREPVEDIKSQLKCILAEQIVDRWLNGATTNNARATRDTTAEGNSDIYNLNNPIANLPVQRTALTEALDAYRQGIVEAYNEQFDSENVDFDKDSLHRLTEEVNRIIHKIKKDTARDITVNAGGAPVTMQQNCKQQAQEHFSAIENALKLKCSWCRQLEPGETVWGVNDTVTYLGSLISALQNKVSPDIDTDLGNMGKREEQWSKICGLTSMLTDKQDDMYAKHLEEGLGLIERALHQQMLSLVAFMEKQYLVDLLTVHKGQTTAFAGTLDDWKTRQHKAYETHAARAETASPEEVLLLDKKRVAMHVDYLAESPDAEKDYFAYSLQVFENNVPLGGSRYDFVRLNDSDAEPGVPTFWTESARIHGDLVLKRPDLFKTAYHKSIYEALNNCSNGDAQLIELCRKLGVLAGTAAAPEGGTGVLVPSTPPKTAIYIGAPDCADPTMRGTKADVENKLDAQLGGQASPGKYFRFRHADTHEIRIMKCLHWMPVRFFGVVSYVKERYNRTMNNNDATAINARYYPNVDDRDRDKPDLVPMAAGGNQHLCRLNYEIAVRLPIPGCESGGRQACVAQEAPENRIGVIPASELSNETRDPVYMPVLYSGATLDHGDARLLQHLNEALAAWMNRYGKEHGQAAVDAIRQELANLNALAPEEVSEQHKQMVYAVLTQTEAMVKNARRLY